MEGRSLCVVQGSLEFWVLPPQPPACREHRSALSYLGLTGILRYKMECRKEKRKRNEKRKGMAYKQEKNGRRTAQH